MAEGGAPPDELLEGVRALLRGQHRLEQLVADLAKTGPHGEPSAPKPEGSDAGAVRGDDSEPAVQPQPTYAHQKSVEDLGLCAQQSDMRNVAHVADNRESTRLWFQTIRVLEEIEKRGSDAELTRECGAAGGKLLRQPSDTDRPTTKRSEMQRKRTRMALGQQTQVQYEQASSNSSRALAFWRYLSQYTVLSPASSRRACFDLLSLILLGYNLSSIPYFLAFDIDVVHNVWLRTIEDLSVLFWSFDLLMNFRTGYYKDGFIHMNPARIARHYLKSTFIVDFLALALDILAFAMRELQSSASGGTLTRFFRILKFWRVVRLGGVLRMVTISERFDGSAYGPHLTGFAKSAFNVFKFVVVLMWINHLLACFWCFLGRAATPDTGATWMDLHTGSLEGSYSQLGVTYQYLSASHWALTQMTPGSMQVVPVNSAERAFNIGCLLCGLLVFSTLVSSISANVAQLKIAMQRHSAEMEKLDRFLQGSQIDPELRMQVSKQVKHRLMRRQQLVIKDLTVLEKLSTDLRNELQLALCNPHCLDHPLLNFLSTADSELWIDVCWTCVDFSVWGKSDKVFLFKSQAEGMYFVTKGALVYTMDESFHTNVLEEVESGAWLSEAALWCHWWHMGCAEVKAATSCEVLLLRAAKLIPILLKSGLIGQLIWAYAISFHNFLQQSRPPLFNWPNDLVVPFSADEVIAAMPKDATAILGRNAIQVLMAPPKTLLAGWLSLVRQGNNIDELEKDVRKGGSALLVTAKRGVVRTVLLVVIQLRREDGRQLVRLRRERSADGTPQATCRLPGAKQRAGEHAIGCLDRLLQGKLRALEDGFTVTEVERRSEQEQSQKFGVPTRYVRTVVSGRWLNTADEPLRRFLVDAQQPEPECEQPKNSRNLPSLAWWQNGGLGSASLGSSSDQSHLSGTAEVFALPTDSGFYAWLTDEEFKFFSSQQGQPRLFRWLSGLSELVEAAKSDAASVGEADADADGVPRVSNESCGSLE